MAPRLGQDHQAAVPEVTAPYGFWNRLWNLQPVKATHDLYEATKLKYHVVGYSLDLLELSLSVATEPVRGLTQRIPGASKVDDIACHCLETVEATLPLVWQSPLKAARSVKDGIVSSCQSGVRAALRTQPGRAGIRALEGSITWSDERLETAEQPDIGKKKTILNRLRRSAVSMSVGPSASVLKATKRAIVLCAGLRRTDSQAVEVTTRKKVTPRKRLPSQSIFGKFTQTALCILGISYQQGRGFAAEDPRKPVNKGTFIRHATTTSAIASARHRDRSRSQIFKISPSAHESVGDLIFLFLIIGLVAQVGMSI